ncbi:oxidoreductase-like protein [Hysterangium stoloniferum]|nr:oxidoreductase-like protein [Hysterangium stoloniferum]
MFNILIRKKSCPLLLRSIHTSNPQSSITSNAQYHRQNSRKRGGQNLTIRDLRLSKSIRQKQAFTRAGEREPEHHAVDPSSMKNGGHLQREGDSASTLKAVRAFRGIAIPQKPKPPESDECCMSGCAICVYDLYLGSLETYREELASMRATLQRQNVPVSEWPEEIRAGNNRPDDGQDPSVELDVSLSAFAQLEKALRERTNR